MKDEAGRLTMELDADDLRSLQAIIAESRGRRISSALFDGSRVWIKRYDAQSRPFAKRLHSFISPFLPYPFLRSPKETNPAGMAEREKRKAQAFLAAGFEVPRIVYGEGPVLVLSDVAPIIQDRLKCLRKENAQEHDELLIHCAHALGKAHAKGLCHGRPHPRDFFQKNGVAGFLDFEEEPEAVMPLAVAQARDVWLLLFRSPRRRDFQRHRIARSLPIVRRHRQMWCLNCTGSLVCFDLPSRRSGCFVMSFWVAMDGGFCRRWNFSMQTLMRPANQAKESDNTKRRDVP